MNKTETDLLEATAEGAELALDTACAMLMMMSAMPMAEADRARAMEVATTMKRSSARLEEALTAFKKYRSTVERLVPPTQPAAEVAPFEPPAPRRQREKSFLRAPHGRAKEHGTPGPRVEVPPADELSVAQAVPRLPVDARGARGRFAPGNLTSIQGGKGRGRQVAYATRLGLRAEFIEQAPDDFRRHMAHAGSYRQARIAELAMTVGQEGIGPGVKVRIGQAALQIGCSKYLFEQAVALMAKSPELALKFFGEGRKMDDSSRQNELCGHELAVREAKARGVDRGPRDPLERFGPSAPTSTYVVEGNPTGEVSAEPPASNRAGRVDES
jgi:hypothetical protein